MATFELAEVKDPTPVQIRTPSGAGTTVHLTDHGDKTLCGREGQFQRAHHHARWWQDADPTCLQCIRARDGKARVRREFR